MLVAFVLTATMLKRDEPSRSRTSLLDPFRALADRRLLMIALAAMFYTYAFFTVLAWTPFALGYGPFAIGAIFFGWGVLVAVCGVVVGPRLAARIGEGNAVVASLVMYTLLMVAFALGSPVVIVIATVLSGIATGCLNTFLTGLAMSVSDAPRPVASAGYNFLRWLGGAAAAILVGHLAEWSGSPQLPYVVAGVLCLVAVALAFVSRANANPRTVPDEAVIVGQQEGL